MFTKIKHSIDIAKSNGISSYKRFVRDSIEGISKFDIFAVDNIYFIMFVSIFGY